MLPPMTFGTLAYPRAAQTLRTWVCLPYGAGLAWHVEEVMDVINTSAADFAQGGAAT